MKRSHLVLALAVVFSTCAFANTDPNLVAHPNDDSRDETTLLIKNSESAQDQAELQRKLKDAEERVAEKKDRQTSTQL